MVGMIVVVALAAWVIFEAAYHPIRQGSQVLTPEGERLTRDARERARTAAATARRAAVDVRSTVRGARSATHAPGGSGEPGESQEADETDVEPGRVPEAPIPEGDQSGADPVEAAAEDAANVAAQPERQTGTAGAGQPPRQQGSPVATPASGMAEQISGTISG